MIFLISFANSLTENIKIFLIQKVNDLHIMTKEMNILCVSPKRMKIIHFN